MAQSPSNPIPGDLDLSTVPTPMLGGLSAYQISERAAVATRHDGARVTLSTPGRKVWQIVKVHDTIKAIFDQSEDHPSESPPLAKVAKPSEFEVIQLRGMEVVDCLEVGIFVPQAITGEMHPTHPERALRVFVMLNEKNILDFLVGYAEDHGHLRCAKINTSEVFVYPEIRDLMEKIWNDEIIVRGGRNSKEVAMQGLHFQGMASRVITQAVENAALGGGEGPISPFRSHTSSSKTLSPIVNLLLQYETMFEGASERELETVQDMLRLMHTGGSNPANAFPTNGLKGFEEFLNFDEEFSVVHSEMMSKKLRTHFHPPIEADPQSLRIIRTILCSTKQDDQPLYSRLLPPRKALTFFIETCTKHPSFKDAENGDIQEQTQAVVLALKSMESAERYLGDSLPVVPVGHAVTNDSTFKAELVRFLEHIERFSRDLIDGLDPDVQARAASDRSLVDYSVTDLKQTLQGPRDRNTVPYVLQELQNRQKLSARIELFQLISPLANVGRAIRSRLLKARPGEHNTL